MHEVEGKVGPEGHLDYAKLHLKDRPCAIYPMVYDMQGIHCVDECPFSFRPSDSIFARHYCTGVQLALHIT